MIQRLKTKASQQASKSQRPFWIEFYIDSNGFCRYSLTGYQFFFFSLSLSLSVCAMRFENSWFMALVTLRRTQIDSVYSWGMCILCDGIDFSHALAVVMLWELGWGLGFFSFFLFVPMGFSRTAACRWGCRKNREGKRWRRWDLFLTVGSFCLPDDIYQNKNWRKMERF